MGGASNRPSCSFWCVWCAMTLRHPIHKKLPAIAHVIQWDNGMLMVFDARGEQIPEYQGWVGKVGERVTQHIPRERWEHLTWRR